jgi:hypothetical protein
MLHMHALAERTNLYPKATPPPDAEKNAGARGVSHKPLRSMHVSTCRETQVHATTDTSILQ